VAVGVDVMLNSMLWCWLHIPSFQNGGKMQARNLELAAFGWGQKLAMRGRVGPLWTGFPDNQNWLVSPDGHGPVMQQVVKRCQRVVKLVVALSSQN
jgi:hypothetical protein